MRSIGLAVMRIGLVVVFKTQLLLRVAAACVVFCFVTLHVLLLLLI